MSSFEHIIGVSVSATKPDTTTAPASVTANSRNRRPVRARREGNGRIDGGKRQGHRNDGEADFARTLHGSIERFHAVFDVAIDVFEHDDGVIDHEADSQHEGEQGERVDGKTRRDT